MGMQMNEEILEFLKNVYDARLTCSGRWLYWDNGEWIVRNSKPSGKGLTTVLYRGERLSSALLCLEKGTD